MVINETEVPRCMWSALKSSLLRSVLNEVKLALFRAAEDRWFQVDVAERMKEFLWKFDKAQGSMYYMKVHIGATW